jgi:hypothetical protein
VGGEEIYYACFQRTALSPSPSPSVQPRRRVALHKTRASHKMEGAHVAEQPVLVFSGPSLEDMSYHRRPWNFVLWPETRNPDGLIHWRSNLYSHVRWKFPNGTTPFPNMGQKKKHPC